MKKILAAALVLCLAVVFVGCGKLPDPEAALQKTLDSITNADDAYVDQLREIVGEAEILDLYPELENQYLEVIKAAAKQIEYSIVESTVDKKAKTAVVMVEVTRVDEAVLEDWLGTWIENRIMEMMMATNDVDEQELAKELFAETARYYADPMVDRVTDRVEVKMTYNSKDKVWVIDNPNVLFGA